MKEGEDCHAWQKGREEGLTGGADGDRGGGGGGRKIFLFSPINNSWQWSLFLGKERKGNTCTAFFLTGAIMGLYV